MRKQLTALLTTAALVLGAAPMTVFADDIAADELSVTAPSEPTENIVKEEPTEPAEVIVKDEPTVLPEWVPRDYAQTVDFCNTYGATHVKDGYVCIVRSVPADVDLHEGFVETYSEEPMSQFIPQFVPGGNPEDIPAAPEDFAPVAEPMGPLYQFEVSVYHPHQEGELKITWSSGTAAAAMENVFTFQVTDKGYVYETDLLSWLPDCTTEFNRYEKTHPTLSVHNGYIVYSARLAYSSGFKDYLSVVGTGGVEEIYSSNIQTLYSSSMYPAGGSEPVLKVFRPVRAGDLQMIASERRPWASDDPVFSEMFWFTIAEDLTVRTARPFKEVYGDCNGDGELSVLDLVTMRKYLHGLGTLEHPELADLDGDGQVDIFDFAMLRQRLFVKTEWEMPQDLKYEMVAGGMNDLGEDAPPIYDYSARLCFTYDSLMRELPDQKKEGDVYIPGLKTISKETFEDKAVILLTSSAGAKNRLIEVEGVERSGAALNIRVCTYQVPGVYKEHFLLYTLVVVDKSMIRDGLNRVFVDNHDVYPMPAQL